MATRPNRHQPRLVAEEFHLNRRTVFWLAVALAAFLGTFVLPFFFPLKVPVFSPVYTAGGNNRVGAIALACVGVLATLLCWRFRYFAEPVPQQAGEDRQPARRWMWAAMAVVTLYAAGLGVMMVRSGMYYADAGYFLTQLRSGLIFHKTLYRDVEFAYGPLMYYWPACFLRVLGLAHVSATAAYVVSLCVMEAVGTAMLFYTVCAMPMRRNMKIAAFLLLAIVTLDPQEGLNYTAFRFVCSIATLVLLTRQRRVASAGLVAAAGALFNFAVSPEMGVAFVAAACVYGGYRALVGGARWLVPAVAAVAGSGLFAMLVGADYFRTLKEFANGGYNMLLEPAPHIYLLLFCAVGLAPAVVAAALAGRHEDGVPAAGTGLLLGVYIAGLALLPAALGRCDPLHVSYNGWPIFLLSFVALDRMRLPARRIGLAVALLFCTYSVMQEYALGSGPISKMVLQRPDPYEDVDLSRLQQALGGRRVSFPWYTPLRASNALTAAGEYQPLYLCILAVDAHAEQRTIDDVRQGDFLLAPNFTKRASQNAINNVGMKYRLRFGYRYKQRHEPYLQGALLVRELEANWRDVGTFGSYELYHKER
ncbi:MAG: hypothetical protein ACRYGF_16100 [Janthinobacterium lividum]